jgi:divalent metal cation (Fe/Co/Zn/Cd) transporter
MFAIYEGVHKWQHPEPIEGRWWWVPIAVLLVAIALEGYSFRTAMVESNRTRGKRSWVEFVRTAKSPELPVVLLEDTAALIGLVFALFGVSMTLVTGNGRWDALGTLLIGLLLVVVALALGLEMNSLLIGESANRDAVERIRAALVGGAVESVIHMRTMHLGPEELLVAAKIAVRGSDSAAEVAAAIDEAERRVRAVEPIARVIYLEPDIRRPAPAVPVEERA